MRGFGGSTPKRAGGFAAFDTPPKLPLGGDNQMLIKRIGRYLNLDPLASAGNYREYRSSRSDNPKVMLQLWRILFDCRFFGERPWQHELGLENGLASLHPSIEGSGHPGQHRMADLPLNVRDHLASIGLKPQPIEVLSHRSELDYQIAREVLRLDLATLFPP
jgi:hypothetical protein